ncbi:MAG: hypothetical protein ACHQ01_04605 [Candidatus Limnocylindrales bacterium]
MLDRVRRPMGIAIDGTLTPIAGSRLRIEAAGDESTLYREIAAIRGTDHGVAQAASRWGLLARVSSNIALGAKQLGAYFSARREELFVEAQSPTANGATERLFQATSGAMIKLFEAAVERVRREYEVSDEDMAALEQAAATADLSSTRALAASAVNADQSIRRRHSGDGLLPRWVRDLDEAGDLDDAARALGTGLEAIGHASTPSGMAEAISAFRELMPSVTSTADDDDERDAVLAPLIEEIELGTRGERVTREEDDRLEAASGRVAARALLAYWRAADTPGVEEPEGVRLPDLGDPDTWRTVIALAAAVRRPDGGASGSPPPLVPAERASDWRAFSIECGLWRDAIDALGRAEHPDADGLNSESLHKALVRLGRQVGPILGLPPGDLEGLDPTAPEIVRGRLIRWVVVRCSISGVAPRPRGGAVGTEGRALLSIYDALTDVYTDAEPRRQCIWPDCLEPLPRRSYPHRQYCDTHRRKKAADRVARRRAADRASKTS